MFRIRNFTFMIIAVVALFIGRTLSEPLLSAKESNMEAEGQEAVITVGNFNNSGNSNKDSNTIFKEGKVNYLIHGMIPLIMYLLSLVCLLDLIKTTYKKFMKEGILVYKTAYLLLIVFQMCLIGLISFYVADISYGTLIIWVIGAILTVQVAFHGGYLIDLVKISKER